LKRSDDVAGTAVPLVSVCLPVYNGAATVGETISSLLGQSHPNFEIVVADNASADRTGEIVASFNDPRIRCRRNDHNVGVFTNWNLAVRDARGEYIAVYHADDVYHPDILTAESDFLSGHPEAGAVFALDDWIDEDGRRIGEARLPPELSGRILYGFHEVFESLLLYGNNFLRCLRFMARRAVFDCVGYFDERLEPFRSARDLDFFLRLLREFPIGIIDRKLVRYRISKRQGTAGTVYLRTGDSDHHRVMDYFLAQQGGTEGYSTVAIQAYNFYCKVDLLFRAANYVLIDDMVNAKKLIFEGRTGIARLARFNLCRWAYVLFAWCCSAALRLGWGRALKPLVSRAMAFRIVYY
jgi:glycosyltransferase involved in cell wall biosynthesis